MHNSQGESRMWVNVLVFLATAASAAYLYLRRNFGWFRARGVAEHDPALPFGTPEFNEVIKGKTHFLRYTNLIYNK